MKKKIVAIFAVLMLVISCVVLAQAIIGGKGAENTEPEKTASGGFFSNLFGSKEKIYEEAKPVFDAGDTFGALEIMAGAKDKHKTESYVALLATAQEKATTDSIAEAKAALKTSDNAAAQAAMDKLYKYVPEQKALTEALYTQCTTIVNLAPYSGPVEHIFFHPLIAYPELAFDGDSQQKGFDDYFVTVPEFKEVIQQFYDNNYVLIDMRLLYEVDANGIAQKPESLMIPEGKKPLVISIDDLNFYKYMKANGMVHGFKINDENKIVTFTDDAAGNRTFSDDNEIVPILENFVDAHPDFSFKGAKGVVASTGYEGTLGLATDLMDAPEYPQLLEEAKAIAEKLKEMGWIFASHSYGHNSPSKRSYEKIAADNDKWLKEATPVLGETDIYIYPYGELIDVDDPKHQHMLQNGFKFFCGVQSRSAYLKYRGENGVLMQRRNIDGIALKGGRLDDLLDVSKIIDHVRPQ